MDFRGRVTAVFAATITASAMAFALCTHARGSQERAGRRRQYGRHHGEGEWRGDRPEPEGLAARGTRNSLPSDGEVKAPTSRLR